MGLVQNIILVALCCTAAMCQMQGNQFGNLMQQQTKPYWQPQTQFPIPVQTPPAPTTRTPNYAQPQQYYQQTNPGYGYQQQYTQARRSLQQRYNIVQPQSQQGRQYNPGQQAMQYSFNNRQQPMQNSFNPQPSQQGRQYNPGQQAMPYSFNNRQQPMQNSFNPQPSMPFSFNRPRAMQSFNPLQALMQRSMQKPFNPFMMMGMNRGFLAGQSITNDPRIIGGRGIVTSGDGRDATIVSPNGIRTTIDGSDVSYEGPATP